MLVFQHRQKQLFMENFHSFAIYQQIDAKLVLPEFKITF